MIKKRIVSTPSSPESNYDFFSSDDEGHMVNQNSWKMFPSEEGLKTTSVATCIAICCIGLRNLEEYKALGHFGKTGKFIIKMAEEVKTWKHLQISYVGGWNPEVNEMVDQFKAALGQTPHTIKDNYINTFQFPSGWTDGDILGLRLDIGYAANETALTFDSGVWNLVSRLHRKLPHFDLTYMYQAYKEGRIGPNPITLFIESTPTLEGFANCLKAMNPLERELAHIFYILTSETQAKPDFVLKYEELMKNQKKRKSSSSS